MELYNKSIKKKEKINKDVQLIFSQRLTGNIIGQNGTYYLQVNGVQKEILGYTVTGFIKLSNVQNAGFHYLTVFVEDNNGLISVQNS